VEVRLQVYESRPPVIVASFEELRRHIAKADEEASEVGRPNVVFVEMPSGNNISLVVGAGTETVLGFQYGHGDPPYYSSKGQRDQDSPVLTAYASLIHHTEFPRSSVIDMDQALEAVRLFVELDNLPSNIPWMEV
jgi:hypothetical protein